MLPFGDGQQYTSVLLGEQAASKTAARGSTPRARADLARECAGAHTSFRSCWTRFDSWTGCLPNVLGVCRIRTRPCEGRSPGSIPGEDADSSQLVSLAKEVSHKHAQFR